MTNAMKELLTKDDLLIILYRLLLTLRNAVMAEPKSSYTTELAQALQNPKPGDFVIRYRMDNDPIALKIGRLIFSQPATENNLCLHTVTLLDGTITTWTNQRIYKIPTAVFCLKSRG